MRAKTTSRIAGIDVTRAVAIIGMIVIHMANLVWYSKLMLSGLPSAMFAIVAGLTMMIIGQNYTLQTLWKLIARGSIIMLLGLALLPLGGEIQVVLVVMGLLMILVSWIPPLKVRWKVAIFIAASILATVKYSLSFDVQVYPIIAWVAYFVGGMLLYEVYVRQGSATKPAAWVATAISVVVTVAGMIVRFQSEVPKPLQFSGHTGVAGEIVLSVAVTALVLHASLLLCSLAPRWTAPLAALGTMSLTVYVLHVLTAWYWQQHIAMYSTSAAVGFVVLFLLLAMLWRKLVGQGPLERCVAIVLNLVAPSGKAVSQ